MHTDASWGTCACCGEHGLVTPEGLCYGCESPGGEVVRKNAPQSAGGWF